MLPLMDRVLQMEKDLLAYANILTSNQEDAKDLLQDTYYKVLKCQDFYREEANLKAWVLTIMKNTYINSYRRKQHSKMILDDTADMTYLSNVVSSGGDNADVHIYFSEINKKIQDKKVEQRIPFEMFLDGYKYHEIADELNISIGTVKSRIFFMRKKLMEELRDYISSTYVS